MKKVFFHKRGVREQILTVQLIFKWISHVEDHKYLSGNCALRALGLLLADGAPTVGWGKTFQAAGFSSRKRA